MTPWTAACQAPLFFTVSQSVLKFMSTELAMLSSYIALTIWTFVGKVMSLLFKESSKSGKKSLEILLSVVLHMYFNP